MKLDPPAPTSTAADLVPSDRRGWFAAIGWGLAAFVVYFWYAQYIGTIGWNAIELIIAQHLLDHGVYATSLDYPSAIGWRPVGPTLLIALFRWWTDDPVLIYRSISALSLGTLVSTLFLSARLLWGKVAGHVTSFLTFTCPAITTYLLSHTHSYSNVVGLLAVGPAFYLSLLLLNEIVANRSVSSARSATAGLAWGLAYLCRSELQLFAGLFFVLAAWQCRRHRQPLSPLLGYLLAFGAVFIVYNAVAGHVADRDRLLGRKTIYSFYASQGWSDPPVDVTADVESSGFSYAEKLYGRIEANHESVFRAIAHNPPAFARRVGLNLRAFYRSFLDPTFLNPWCALTAIAALLLLLGGWTDQRNRLFLGGLVGLFALSHFFVIFHIDRRYLTMSLPPLLLLAGYGASRALLAARRLPGPAAITAVGLLTVTMVWSARGQWQEFRVHRDNMVVAIATIKSLAQEFSTHAPLPVLARNREPHLRLLFPAHMRMVPEDAFLLSYFTHTAWTTSADSEIFPRDRLYGFRNCDDDYMFLPAEMLPNPQAAGRARVIADFQNQELGHYYLLQMNP